jgi:carbonic anhydrase/acetyltransferase-like protein (isoleucine patch superfamily)
MGKGAIILEGAIIEEYSMVAEGTVIKPDYIVPKGKLVGGVLGK